MKSVKQIFSVGKYKTDAINRFNVKIHENTHKISRLAHVMLHLV